MSSPARIVLMALGPATHDDASAARLRAAFGSTTFDAVYSCDDGAARAALAASGTSGETHVRADERMRGASRETLRAALGAIATAHPGETVLALAPVAATEAAVAVVLDAPADGGRIWCAPFALTIVEVGPDGRGVLRALSADAPPPHERPAGSTRIVLVRHGHAMNVDAGVFSHNPIPLSELGRAQAERSATALRALDVDAIYSSDIVRARETADITGRELGLPVIVDEGLRELAIGDFEGTTLERVRAEHPSFLPWLEVTFRERFPTADFHHPADRRFPNGQCVLDVHATSLAAIREIVAAERGRTVALVSHGWVLQPLLCHIAGVSPRDYFRFTLPTASIAVADVGADVRGVLRTFNAGAAIADVPKMRGAAAAR